MNPGKIVKDSYYEEGDLVETLAEVSEESGGSWEKDKKLKLVGKEIPRIDGYDKVSGTARYTYDIDLPNMAYAVTLRSPHPHAKIKNIDTRKALKLPGVFAIISHANVPHIRWYRGSTYLFDPHLRYAGDEIACIAAESLQIAEEAAALIEVEYQVLPFVVDAEEAMKPGAPKLYDKGNLYRGEPFKYSRGDIKEGLAAAYEVIEDTYTTEVIVHNPAEVHCSVANWDGDRLTVWDSTQAIFNVRDAIAGSLKMPTSKVRIIKKYMGGGFGCKLEGGKYSVMAALLAKKTGRPVKIALDRKEENLSVGNRPDSIQTFKAGVTIDGILTALSQHTIASSGAHATGAGCSWPFRTLYQCPNLTVEEYSVYINAGRARPHRAPGHVQNTFAFESFIDDIAEKVGMDPIAFRLKNYTAKDQVDNLPYTSKRLIDAYEKGAAAIGWQNRKDPGSGPGPVKRGIGMASQIWWGGGGPPAYATLKLNRDGSVQVLSGTQDLGTGTYTFIAQVAAEVLEIPMDKISVILGDTATCPYAPISGGSLTAPSVSPAVHDAAQKMKEKLISGAAALLDLPEDQVRYSEGTVYAKSDPAKKITSPDIVRKMRERVLVTVGARNANPKGYAINTFGAQFAEVEVDTMTGKVKVLKVVAANDIGRVLNKKTMENQFYGGITQGIGIALMEQRVMDQAAGKMLNPNMHDYKIPTIKDIPEIEVIIVSDADTKISRVGAKGTGEPAIIPTPGAIANAVYNAIGVRIKSLPITPDKVLKALSGV